MRLVRQVDRAGRVPPAKRQVNPRSPGRARGRERRRREFPSPITVGIWGSILDYFFINYTLRPGTLARRTPFRSHRQRAVLLSEVNSLHRITSPLSTLPSLATHVNEHLALHLRKFSTFFTRRTTFRFSFERCKRAARGLPNGQILPPHYSYFGRRMGVFFFLFSHHEKTHP